MADDSASKPEPIVEVDEHKDVGKTVTSNLDQPEAVQDGERQLSNEIADDAVAQSVAINEQDENSSTDTESNVVIETDHDEILEDQMHGDKDVVLFEYQNELARRGCDGENVVIMAPTNSGKTYVASRIIQVHLRRLKAQNQLARVVFLVENEALAFQQGKVFAEQLPAYRTKVFTGSVQTVKGQYLRDHLTKRDILVATAQILVNDLTSRKIQSLKEFSLIVFDECHHSYNDHMFNVILRHYLDMKINGDDDAADLPQIVGMTASLGVSGSTDDEKGLKHMKRVMANMDARFLCTVRTPENLEALRKHTNCPTEDLVAVKPRDNDLFRKTVLDAVGKIETHVNRHVAKKRQTLKEDQITARVQVNIIGTEQFLQWSADFVQSITELDDSLRRILNPCRLHMESYSNALLLHKDARIQDALRVLKSFIDEFEYVSPLEETDATLMNIYDEMEIKYKQN